MSYAKRTKNCGYLCHDGHDNVIESKIGHLIQKSPMKYSSNQIHITNSYSLLTN